MSTTSPREKKLLDQVRETLRAKHYSYRTEETYIDWQRRFILFHKKRHPRELTGSYKLMVQILYGSGLRLMECLRLRVKDIGFENHHIIDLDLPCAGQIEL